ncbi:MAG: LPS export ABC transporter periplasmic protein LptC [Acidobacteriia bacterium]|nr:LPS export ABC transporter periplasmic protein LptC [Terriglobia bacterium]
MAWDTNKLRRLFAAGAVIAVLVAAGFYVRGILKSGHGVQRPVTNLPANTAESAEGFTFAQSEGGKTLFTVHASRFLRYKDSGRGELHDVSIVIYGRDEDRSDHIYGSLFVFDPASGDISAEGEVQIDLDANTKVVAQPNQAATRETQNLIHVKTRGLTFNRNSGIAQTKEKIEFRVPEAGGSAMGATYDSHSSVLTLKSAVKIDTTDKQKASITGQSATISKEPRNIVLHGARIDQPPRLLLADKITVVLTQDNTVERILGSGHVRSSVGGPKGFDVTAPQGELVLAAGNQLRSGTLSGGVDFQRRGDAPAQGKAGRVLLTFGAKNRVTSARAEDAVDLKEGAEGKSRQIQAAAVDLAIKDGKLIQSATTSDGPGKIILSKGASVTTISAARLQARFNSQNRPVSIVGSPDARIVSSSPGQPDQVATSRELNASFNDKGEITAGDLTGDFHFEQGQRTATANRGRYNPADESFTLIGSPRVVDSGATITADSIQLLRKTESAVATGHVKTTYNDLKPQAGGMLASGEPVHVTGTSATASRSAGVAKYAHARLWQGANIVDAPAITFDKLHRSLLAQGDSTSRVTTVFVTTDKKGKSTPVNVTADKLTYVDSERKAVFTGKVTAKVEDSTIDADTVQILLTARGSQAGSQPASQLDRIVAQGDIRIQQPQRRATASQAVYTAGEEKFVLTGVPGKLPSIFDAEHGQISGDSLTFFTHDDRVLVGSGESSHQAQTRNRDASKK